MEHPNIIKVFAFGEHKEFPYLAMEYMPGGTLAAWLKHTGALRSRDAAELVAKLASAVAHAHSHGVVHRDIKPGNVLLSESGEPRLADFGLAKVEQSDLTGSGAILGTPAYMAPEQAAGKVQEVGTPADVYALGAVLYELLTGRPPFLGSPTAALQQVLNVEPERPRSLNSGIPRDLETVCLKCLAKTPHKRYPTAQALGDDLKRFLNGKPINARPVGSLERAYMWMRRNPLGAIFLAALMLGFAITSSLAVLLARSVKIEKTAREEAQRASGEATTHQLDAEAARDKLKDALVGAERDRERAEGARTKAETNLQIARQVIRTTFHEFSRDARFEGKEFRDYRNKLIASVRKFRDEVAVQATDSTEWLDDLADVSHWLGFLEYLNDNHLQSVIEYRTAAEAARKWAAANPNDPEPRWMLTDSLVNAGNTLFNYRKYREAEAAYREAVEVISKVVAKHPAEKYRRTEILACVQLANVLRFTGTSVEQVHVANAAYRSALILTLRKTPDNTRLLQTAKATLALALLRFYSETALGWRLLETALSAKESTLG